MTNTRPPWTITPLYGVATIFVQYGSCDEPTPRMVVTRVEVKRIEKREDE